MLEKLVEEIRKSWCQDCKMADIDDASGFDNCGPNEQFVCDERVRQSIALIGKAYAEGMPLPDEVGRGKMLLSLEQNRVMGELRHSLFSSTHISGDYNFIALRKEEEK